MESDLYVQIRQRFNKFIDEAKKNGVKNSALSFDISKLETLTPEQQVRFLDQQFKKLKAEIDNSDSAVYYYFVENDMLVYKIFSFRMLFNEENEEQNIRDAFIYYEKTHLLHKLLLTAKKKQVPYTLKDFLENKENEIFSELDEQPYNTPDTDYLLIREWQTAKKVECATCGFHLLKENLSRAAEKENNPDELLKAEQANLENINGNVTEWEPGKLNEELSKLIGLKYLMLPEPLNEFHSQLCAVIKGEKFNRLLNARFLEDSLKQISEFKISNPVIFHLTLLMYGRWINDVLNGKADLNEKEHISYNELFYQTIHEGRALGEISVEKSIRKYKTHYNNAELHKEALIHEYHELFILFNNLGYPHYFDFLENEKKLKNAFINDCLYSINVELPVEELKRTIVLNAMIECLDEEISLVCHNPLAPLCNIPFDKIQLVEILCKLAPETTQIKQLMELIKRVNILSHNDRIPGYFITDELNHSFTLLFIQTVIQFKYRMEGLSIEKRGRFISEQQRELKYMLRLCEIGNKKLTPFDIHVKHILKDESISTKQIYPYRIAQTNEPVERKKKTKIKALHLGGRPGPRAFRPILVAMNREFSLFGGDTTVDDFLEVTSCKDLRKNKKIIQFGLKNNLFYHFMIKSKPWIEYFTPAQIEKSGIFISLNDGVFNAHLLYNSKIISKEDNDRMDAIFNAKYK